jgi:hypothetical protein
MRLPVRQWITFEIHQFHIMESLSVRLSAVTSNSLLSRLYIHIEHLAMGRRTGPYVNSHVKYGEMARRFFWLLSRAGRSCCIVADGLLARLAWTFRNWIFFVPFLGSIFRFSTEFCGKSVSHPHFVSRSSRVWISVMRSAVLTKISGDFLESWDNNLNQTTNHSSNFHYSQILLPRYAIWGTQNLVYIVTCRGEL